MVDNDQSIKGHEAMRSQEIQETETSAASYFEWKIEE